MRPIALSLLLIAASIAAGVAGADSPAPTPSPSVQYVPMARGCPITPEASGPPAPVASSSPNAAAPAPAASAPLPAAPGLAVNPAPAPGLTVPEVSTSPVASAPAAGPARAVAKKQTRLADKTGKKSKAKKARRSGPTYVVRPGIDDEPPSSVDRLKVEAELADRERRAALYASALAMLASALSDDDPPPADYAPPPAPPPAVEYAPPPGVAYMPPPVRVVRAYAYAPRVLAYGPAFPGRYYYRGGRFGPRVLRTFGYRRW